MSCHINILLEEIRELKDCKFVPDYAYLELDYAQMVDNMFSEQMAEYWSNIIPGGGHLKTKNRGYILSFLDYRGLVNIFEQQREFKWIGGRTFPGIRSSNQ